MQLSNIKAIVFDAYGTLLNVQALGGKLTKFYGAKATAINQLWRVKQLEYTWLRGLMGQYTPFSTVTMEALEYACEEIGLTLTTPQKNELMGQYMQLEAFPEVPGLLKQLSANYSLSILSNADPSMLKGAVDYNEIGPYLEKVLSVDPLKTFKPYPAVYQLAPDKLGYPTDQIAFISSNTWDVAGAKSFGLKVIWLNRGRNKLEKLGFFPDWEIDSLSALLP